MTDFAYDCYEKKQLARQAQHRKRGSKSKRCPLSTDYMTQKQWKERNGKVVSLCLNEPIRWQEFRELPPTMQEEYILHLRDTYGASASAIAKMMGVVYNTLYKWLSSNGIHVSFSRGRTMSPEQKQAWAAFAGYEAPEDPQAECAVEAQQSPKPEEPAPECVPEPAGKMHMERFSLTFSGVINPSAIANSLIHILGENATGTVEIRCELMV